jgi:hypothetical protein
MTGGAETVAINPMQLSATVRDCVTAPCMHDADDRREIGMTA